MKRTILFIIWHFLVFIPAHIFAQTIVTINGAPSFNTSALTVSEAGLDFPASISEIQANTTINITNASVNNPNNYDYRLLVNLLNLPEGLNVTIQRTGSGTSRTGGGAQGKISGATTPIILSNMPVEFINGTGDRLDVPVSFGLSNLSVTQPAGNVSLTLQFTATAF